ncbi:hypothetical protein DSM43518_04811 [Mycobacterium marinum]|uniref:hypothetical protein n=1 Tax=Mycobacterium marinum TaxID=1781 RepID=UPI000CD9254B|nr:hypothetical protein [Mycobacterium marinum]AXN51269.1 hypothetical protein CCUG20998_03873 [Mycobacterium marinum]RFZ02824.1 hypothetical protein DSM43518_04811 [Mycobacterium marinum]RFZ26015.1 hypothetical protein DSM43519_01329 [Mycobacterium marinum]RFZ28894.1 hypothetical protein DSM44344_01161 [Mycobacterium marinum]RFZ39080.1 hypothetical protein NCTC2275_00348 [Mycobacterium marinum]
MKPEKMLEVSTRNHQMAVLRDEGLYRHIRFAEPGTSIWRFDLVTWPGHLVITGDLEDFHFARLADMFEFFRNPVGYINASYWAEKLRGPTRYKSYSPDRFKQRVFEYFWESRAWTPGPHRPLWQAICDRVLSDDVIHDECTARQALSNFRFHLINDPLPSEPVEDFRPHRIQRPAQPTHRAACDIFEFTDSWEWDFREYDYHFLVSLHAIVWGINQYDRAKAAAS